MTSFFTADTHCGDHLTLDIRRRALASVRERDDVMVAGRNEVAGHDDEVWHLGDVARKPADVPALDFPATAAGGARKRCATPTWADIAPRRHDHARPPSA